MPQSGRLDRFRLEVPGKSLCRSWLHSRLDPGPVSPAVLKAQANGVLTPFTP